MLCSEDVHRVGESVSGVCEACLISLNIFDIKHCFIKNWCTTWLPLCRMISSFHSEMTCHQTWSLS